MPNSISTPTDRREALADWITSKDNPFFAKSMANRIIATPVQAQAIPPLMEGRDVVATAQTGTGKTPHHQPDPPPASAVRPTNSRFSLSSAKISFIRHGSMTGCLSAGSAGQSLIVDELS
jgi:hypothetical protein